MSTRARSRFVTTISLVAVLALAAGFGAAGASGAWRGSRVFGASGAGPQAHPAQVCSSSDNGPRNPADPLDTAGFSGTNPLSGAHLFVESPWQYGGDAADAIANDVGLGYLSNEESGNPIPWAQFKARVDKMHMSRVRLLQRARAREDRQLPAGASVQPVHRGRLRDRRFSPGKELTCAACSERIQPRLRS